MKSRFGCWKSSILNHSLQRFAGVCNECMSRKERKVRRVNDARDRRTAIIEPVSFLLLMKLRLQHGPKTFAGGGYREDPRVAETGDSISWLSLSTGDGECGRASLTTCKVDVRGSESDDRVPASVLT